MRNQIFMRISSFLLLFALLVGSGIVVGIRSSAFAANSVSIDKVKKELPTNVSSFINEGGANITKLVNGITAKQNEIGQSLVEQLTDNDKNLSNAQKTEIIEALGTLRYIPAVPILVEQINFEKEAAQEAHPLQTAILPLRSIYAAQFTLMLIGRPASDYILGSLANNLSYLSSDYVSSRAAGFAKVLYQVEGPRYGLLKLQDRQKEATDPQIKAQYQMVIDQFERIVTASQ